MRTVTRRRPAGIGVVGAGGVVVVVVGVGGAVADGSTVDVGATGMTGGVAVVGVPREVVGATEKGGEAVVEVALEVVGTTVDGLVDAGAVLDVDGLLDVGVELDVGDDSVELGGTISTVLSSPSGTSSTTA